LFTVGYNTTVHMPAGSNFMSDGSSYGLKKGKILNFYSFFFVFPLNNTVAMSRTWSVQKVRAVGL